MLSRTGLLLLESQVGPVLLHAVTQGHPELGLLSRGHALPPLLDVGQRRVGDGVGGGGSSGDNSNRGSHAAGPDASAQQRGGRRAHHCGSGGGFNCRRTEWRWVQLKWPGGVGGVVSLDVAMRIGCGFGWQGSVNWESLFSQMPEATERSTGSSSLVLWSYDGSTL